MVKIVEDLKAAVTTFKPTDPLDIKILGTFKKQKPRGFSDCRTECWIKEFLKICLSKLTTFFQKRFRYPSPSKAF